MSKNDKILTGKLSRFLEVSSATLKVSIKQLEKISFSAIASSKNLPAIKEKYDKEISEIIFEHVSKLRGPTLKLAQILSMETGLLPPAYIEKLTQTQYNVPPLRYSNILKVFQEDFNCSPMDIFENFSTTPFSAASFGQVHEASLSGKKYAVKIQYPHIKESLDYDFSLFLSIIKTLPNSSLLLKSIKYLSKYMKKELDYKNELKNIQFFRKNSHAPNILIPTPFPKWSTENIFTMELIEGEVLSKTKKNDSFISQTIYNFFGDSLINLRTIHADPHPGNFIVLGNNQIGVIDFGLVKKNIGQKEINLLILLINPDYKNEKKKLLDLYVSLGADLGDNSDFFYEEVILPYQKIIHPIFQEIFFDFSNKTSISFQLNLVLLKLSLHPSMKSFSEDFTLIHKTFHGVISLMFKLGSKIKVKEKFLDLNNFC